MHLYAAVASLCVLADFTRASVTVWRQYPLYPTATSPADAANYTGPAAYNPTILTPPPIPVPPPPNTFFIQLLNNNVSQSGNYTQGVPSIAQKGTFFGFSVEMSVITQVFGLNSSFIQVPFLNLMANIKQRAGGVAIRVGGNTQEVAAVVSSTPSGQAMGKIQTGTTPIILITPEIINMFSHISSLVGVKWYLGVGMNDTSHPRLQIAEVGEAILGDNLLGLQVGNEPDLYGRHGLGGRNAVTYTPAVYFTEFGEMMSAINGDPSIPVKNNVIGPSITGGVWTIADILNTSYLTTYANNLKALSVEHYPDDNCGVQFGGLPKIPQTEFANYLNHTSAQSIVAPFINATAIAQAAGKEFLMMETNTASCGGFPGVSDSFGAALWGLDYGFQMAYHNFNGAYLHVSGQSVYYNPFTPPPTNQSMFHAWTVGAIYFAPLIIAEAFGSSNTAQVVDLNANNGNIYTPAYAIYEQGTIARVALFNYITDPSGGTAYTVSIAVGGGSTGQPNASPSLVTVKYLTAPSAASINNITWAGQGFGGNFESDGRLQGNLSMQTINCANNVCSIRVPAPGFALVFLTSSALSESTPQSPQTFSTTALTRTFHTATVNPSLLATSNGHSAFNSHKLTSTSVEKNQSSRLLVPSTMVSIALTLGAILVRRLSL